VFLRKALRSYPCSILICHDERGRQLRRPLFTDLSKFEHAGLPDWIMLKSMASDCVDLTREEFASLLTVGNTPVKGPAPVIPAAHSARLIALGYMVDLAGRLRMTTPGRIRMYAGQLAS
jgi:hypothetical protein